MTKSEGVPAVRERDDTGAAAVEFALLLIPFVTIVFGVISGGVVFNDKLSLSQGAREAARYGATLPGAATDATTFLTTVRTTARGDAYGQIGTDAATYCVGFIPKSASGTSYYLTDSGGTATAYTIGSSPCGSGWPSPPTTRGTVWVIAEKPASFNLIFAKYNMTLVSVAVSYYETSS